MSGLQLPPLSLYVHIPWCVRKCPYCDFNSHERNDLPEHAYRNALIEDLKQDLGDVQGRAVQSIFFGGGTPSLMSGDFYTTLIDQMKDLVAFADDIEITLEANPGTVEQGRFDQYRRAGINRLSIGVQSFNSTHLQALGRIHDGNEALRAATAARQAGFDNFNLDLMHGLPEQGRADALADLEQAIALQPAHISWYELTIEPNTAFYNNPPARPDDDTLADIEEAGFRLLARHGYQRYEISAFAQPERRAHHNLNYWLFGDYLGIGAGAHAKITHPGMDQIQRYQKTRQPEAYLAGQSGRRRHERQLGNNDRALEYFLNTLRLTEGAPRLAFNPRTGLGENLLEQLLQNAIARRLMSDDRQRIACTPLGLRHLNATLEAIETEQARFA